MLATLALLSAVTVSTKAQLDAAIARARGGEVIQLAKGNYGKVSIKGRNFRSILTIQSAAAATPATFSGLELREVRNLTFKDIEITRARGNDPVWAKMAEIYNATNISFIGGFVHGPANANWQDDMHGIYARNSSNLRISGVSFHDMTVALTIEDSDGYTVENNFFSFMSRDAMNVPGTRSGRIDNNSMFLFDTAPEAHPDGIQCWTTGKKTGCKNMQITNNKFFGSPGHEFQGVFLGDEAKVGGYDNIQITGNVMTSLMWNAIYVGGNGSSIAIRNNTITAGPNYRSWIYTFGPATLSGNAAPDYVIARKRGIPAGNR